MIRFRTTEAHELLTSTIRTALTQYGLTLVRADTSDFRETLWDNVKFCMNTCSFGIAVFDAIMGEPASPNVSLELGYMLAKERPCLLLKDDRVSLLQADLAGHLCQKFEAEGLPESVRPPILRWLRDLGIRKRPDERVVVFVSQGGTCRDPMAKAIVDVLLRRYSPGFRIRVEAAAAMPPSKHEVSRAARHAIEAMFGEDLLAAHRPRVLSHGLIEDADLILMMDESTRKGLPEEKTQLVRRFFGADGGVADPWPDGEDENTRERYARCAGELRSVIEPNVRKLVEFLELRRSEA